MTTDYDFVCQLIINKSTFLPFQLIQKFGKDSNFIKTGFDEIDINPKEKSEHSWYSYTYKELYTTC